jgi:hypothetical protein
MFLLKMRKPLVVHTARNWLHTVNYNKHGAWQSGAQWCAAGWLADGEPGTVYWPMQSDTVAGCGSNQVNSNQRTGDTTASATCIGKKPSQGQVDDVYNVVRPWSSATSPSTWSKYD